MAVVLDEMMERGLETFDKQTHSRPHLSLFPNDRHTFVGWRTQTRFHNDDNKWWWTGPWNGSKMRFIVERQTHVFVTEGQARCLQRAENGKNRQAREISFSPPTSWGHAIDYFPSNVQLPFPIAMITNNEQIASLSREEKRAGLPVVTTCTCISITLFGIGNWFHLISPVLTVGLSIFLFSLSSHIQRKCLLGILLFLVYLRCVYLISPPSSLP